MAIAGVWGAGSTVKQVCAAGTRPTVGGDLGRPSVPKGCPVPITEAFTDAADTVAHLAECVLEGRKAPVATATERLLETHDGLAIINDIFVPILDVVGQKYDEGAFFLPQLMASAEAVKAGFDLIRDRARAVGASAAEATPVGGDLGRPSGSSAVTPRKGCASPAPTEGRTTARRAREARCRACYRLRFEEAAHYAREHGFAALGTTLSVSPYQYTRIIREELERACAREGIKACFADYRPFYDEATRRSREGGMYRQNYCGCRFSDAEAAAEREERRAARRAAREAELAAHADKRAAAEAERARTRAEKQAYADKQAKKRAILKALREQQ